MNTLVKQALVGVGKAGAALDLPPPAAELATSAECERAADRLLLAAAADSLYRQAGYLPRTSDARNDIAPEDSQPACSDRAAALLGDLLSGSDQRLLIEACTRLHTVGRRLAHALLSAALETPLKKLQVSLRPVLGQRGRWLAGFNRQWKWAASETIHDDAECRKRVWDEGDATARTDALRQQRQIDPEIARRWLADVWKGEKADTRAGLLQTLSERLSSDDEPFLAEAVRDRSGPVRTVAMRLLVQLPNSEYSQRAVARAEAMLAFKPGGMVRKAKLSCTPPEEFDQALRDDGLIEAPPQVVGRRAWWALQVMSLVTPAHWSARFTAQPGELLAAAANDDYFEALLSGWTEAAVLFQATDWLVPLWQQLLELLTPKKVAITGDSITEKLQSLLALMPPADAEQRLLELLSSPKRIGAELSRFFDAAPQIAADRVVKQIFQIGLRDPDNMLGVWLPLLQSASYRAVPELIPALLQQLERSLGTGEPIPYVTKSLNDLGDLLRKRAAIYQEIIP